MQESKEKDLLYNKTHFCNLKKAISLWPSLAILETDFLSEIRMITAVSTAFETTAKNDKFIIIQKDGTVYDFGQKNEYGIKICSKLDFDGEKIITFIQNHRGGIYALTNEGKVYCWGQFQCYKDYSDCDCGDHMAHEARYFIQKNYNKFTCLTILSNIVDIACTKYHTIALTVDGKVYYSHSICPTMHDTELIEVTSNLENKKIVSITSGSFYSIMVTDSGEVYQFDLIYYKQEYVNNYSYCRKVNQYFLKRIDFPDVVIVKVACGAKHALALTDQGDLYVWGENNYGQLGTGNKTTISDPVLLETSEMGKLLDIAAVQTKHISVAVNKSGCLYVWGLHDNCYILIPHAIYDRTMYDVFASENVSYKPLILSSADIYLNEEDVMRCLKVAFDDPLTSDFKIRVEERDIHVHKAILNIRSLYYRNMFQHNWKENSENILKLDGFSYNVYKAYFKYLYTSILDISSEEALDLLKLADMYRESNLKTDCIPIIKRMITTSNVSLVYNRAIEYNEKRLETFCDLFILKYFREVIHTDSFTKLDKSTIIMFIKRKIKDNNACTKCSS